MRKSAIIVYLCVTLMLLVLVATAGCGGSNVAGVYKYPTYLASTGEKIDIIIKLKADGSYTKGSTHIPDTEKGTYKVEDNSVILTSIYSDEPEVLKVDKDGNLVGDTRTYNKQK